MLLALITSIGGELACSLHNSQSEALAALAQLLADTEHPQIPPVIDNIAVAAAAINEAGLDISFSIAPALTAGQVLVCKTDGHAITADSSAIQPIEHPSVLALHGQATQEER